MITITKKVNEVYNKHNPSLYLNNLSQVDKFIKNRINLLMALKLPERIFQNSTCIDYGSGTGLNTLVYDYLGAKCTLVEYDKKSYQYSKDLFKKYSKNKYQIYNEDIFSFRTDKKYDFVISNGVAHHTKNPILNLKICLKSLKKNGFFILGIGETNGFFMRNLQRFILYSLCNSQEEIIKFAKILFKNHLQRSQKFSGRTINQIIADTYLNPKINTLPLNQLILFFKRNNIELYSSYDTIKSLDNLLEIDTNQLKLKNSNKNRNFKKIKLKINLNLNDLRSFSISNNFFKQSYSFVYSKMSVLNNKLNKLTSSINDNDFKKKKKLNINLVKSIYSNISNFDKVDLLNKKSNLNFLKELEFLIKILNTGISRKKKLFKIKKYLLNCKVLLKGFCGVGMNYLVGYKK